MVLYYFSRGEYFRKLSPVAQIGDDSGMEIDEWRSRRMPNRVTSLVLPYNKYFGLPACRAWLARTLRSGCDGDGTLV